MAAGEFELRKEYRLRKRPEFESLRTEALKVASRHLLVLLKENNKDTSRLGITVSTKIDKLAVGRNRFKRTIREVFRVNRHRLSQHFDIVVIARKNATQCSFEDIRREFLGALYHNKFLTY